MKALDAFRRRRLLKAGFRYYLTRIMKLRQKPQ